MYIVFVSAFPVPLFHNSPAVLVLFQLLGISPVLHRQLDTTVSWPQTVNSLLPRPNQFMSPDSISFFLLYPNQAQRAALATPLDTLSSQVIPCCVTTCSYLGQVVITAREHLQEAQIWPLDSSFQHKLLDSFLALGQPYPSFRVEVWRVKALGQCKDVWCSQLNMFKSGRGIGERY